MRSITQVNTKNSKVIFIKERKNFLFLRQFSNEAFGGYTIVWSSGSTNNIEDASKLYSNISLLESLKASKIRVSLRGYYSVVKSDLRQLYYSISELKVKGRYLNF